jgi:predicted ATP-grasp superfamily ATP-dependent carboligase
MINKNLKTEECAVVLGLGVNGLGMVRSLSRENITVFGVYTDKSELGRFSNQCTAISFSKQKGNKYSFKNRLINIAENTSVKPVLFPTSDSYVNLISEFRDELQKYYYFNVVSKEKLNTILNKHLMKELAEKNGLLVPETHHLTSDMIVKKVSKIIAFPCLIKPINSYSTNFSQKNVLIETKDEFRKLYNLNAQYLKMTIAQELIIGDDDNIYQCTAYCDRDSSLLAVFTIRKIRQYPPFFGVTSCGLSTNNEELVEKTKAFLKNIEYRGFCSLEFKLDKKSNKFFFIEMNPRLPYYNALFYDSGVNLSHIAYLDQKYPGNRKIFANTQKLFNYWVHFGFDLSSILERRQKMQKLSLLLWLKSIFASRSFAYWDKKDPLPFIRSILDLAKSVGRKIQSPSILYLTVYLITNKFYN